MTTRLAALALALVCLCGAAFERPQATPRHTILLHARSQHPRPPHATPQHTSAQQASPQQPEPQEPARQQLASQPPASQQTAPQQSAPQQTSPRRLPTVRVEAGRLDRVESVVSFALPPFVTGESLQLRVEGQDDGPTIPLQIDRDRRAWFVLDRLNAGDTRQYTLEPTLDREERQQRVDVIGERDGLTLRALQRPVLRYQADRSEPPRPDIKPMFRRGGYLHPVRTPSGRIITDDYPPAYLHHHGIWAAWAKTVFQGRTPDFWRMGDGTGRVEFESLIDTWSGRVQAGFSASHRYVDLSAAIPTTVLTEIWDVRLYGVGLTPAGPGSRPYRLFDLVLTQELVTSSPLTLPEFLYGGLAFHGARSWEGPGGAHVLTSDAKTRTNADTTPARWCYIGGIVSGANAGLAVLGHPANAHAPQPVRIYPNEPFLNFAPTQTGRLDLAPGRPFVARYRFVTLDGAPDIALFERLWRDYADPVRVEVLPGAPSAP